MNAPRRKPLAFEKKQLLIATLGALPSLVLALASLYAAAWSIYPRLLLAALALGSLLLALYVLQQQFASQLRTLINLVEAVRTGDFSLRARRQGEHSVIGELFGEINQLAETLQQQRLGAEEAQRLLERVMAEINVAIFAFDRERRLRLINPAGIALLGQPREQLIGREALQLGLADFLRQEQTQLIEYSFPGCSGIWQIRHEGYREQGQQQSLLFVTDLQQVLRAEELKAWKQLIRVISHEVNNSLTPIASLSESLDALIRKPELASDWRDDMHDGLSVIQDRARRLTEFIRRYAELARLPAPSKRLFDWQDILRRLPAMLPQQAVQLQLPDSSLQAWGDPVQLEQLLINLLKNAAEAQRDPARPLQLQLQRHEQGWLLSVRDHGAGISNPANLFVPFYSTKPGGAGIGLVLSRQIADAHQGRLQLRNAEDGQGCIAELLLPHVAQG